MDVKTIDELLAEHNVTRDVLIEKNPEYREGFKRLDEYYGAYKEHPNASIGKKLLNTNRNYLKKIQDENPELFSEPVDVPVEKSEPAPVENKDQYIEEFEQLAATGEATRLEELLTGMNPEQVKRLLAHQNFKAIHNAANERNALMSLYLLEQADHYGVLADMVTARGGKILSNLISMKELPCIKIAAKGLRSDPELAKPVLKKTMALEQAMETQDEAIVELIEQLYQELGVSAGEKKATQKLKEEKTINHIIESVRSGKIKMNLSLIAGMDTRMSIAMLNTDVEISDNDTYEYVVPTKYAELFDDAVVVKAEDYTLLRAKSNEFERQFGCTVYELGFAWFNMLNLISVGDVLSIMHIANIAQELLVERDDQQLRDQYRSDLAALMQYPGNSNISGHSYQITKANMQNLQRSGFVDREYCPTKMMYCVIVLHAFKFPANTHPFELITVSSIDKLFQFKVLKGEYGSETFFTDGDILYHNFTKNISTESDLMMLDIARTIVLNIKSKSVSDITKKPAKITGFFPLFYTVPKSNVAIPTFSVHMLEIENRNINWGVYEITDGSGDTMYVNSMAISNFKNAIKSDNVETAVYDGALSHQIFSNPKQGVLLNIDKISLVVRALNKTSFMTSNYGDNYEKYFKAMYEAPHLQNRVLGQLEPVFAQALMTTPTLRIDSTRPNSIVAFAKKAEVPYVAEKTVKAPPAKDERVYLSEADARDLLDKRLFSVFESVINIKGEQRDEAILDNMLGSGIDTIRPKQLVLLGFDIERWKVSDRVLKFKNKYQLRIPNVGFVYYLEKI